MVATAGHVDHGKSTLVRALTGTDPDRLPEERRRGLTLDLGFAAGTLPSGRRLSLVDVPGHERYVGNALSGLAAVRAVLLVVAADRGWQPQTAEHLDAVRALGLRHVVLAVTRCDLADDARAGEVEADALARLAGLEVEAARTPGYDGVARALDRLLDRLPAPDPEARVRLWVDRSFTVRGRGLVVTGTLHDGALEVGDELDCGSATARVRGLQVHGEAVDRATGPTRVAVALRPAGEAPARGDALVTRSTWWATDVVDVALDAALPARPGQLVVHVGTAALPVRARPLGDGHARLALPRALPLSVGDRLVLRDPGTHRGPGTHRVLGGATVVDVAPAPLTRRGAATARAALLRDATPLDLALAPGPLRRTDLAARLGSLGPAGLGSATASGHDRSTGTPGEGPVEVGDWVTTATWLGDAAARLAAQVAALPATAPGVSLTAADVGAVPDPALVAALAERAGLVVRSGLVVNPAHGLGDAEPAVAALERRLAQRPFAAPDRGELRDLGLDARLLATAAAQGRLLRLRGRDGDDVVLPPDAPARALPALAALPQPFAVAAATRALGGTRRVVVPLLEHLDAAGATRREGALRQVIGSSGSDGGSSDGGSTTTVPSRRT